MARHLNRKEKIEVEIDRETDETVNRQSSPINGAVTKRLIFNRLEVIRPALVGKMTRVSTNSIPWLAARVQNIIDNELRSHLTKGQTIRLGGR